MHELSIARNILSIVEEHTSSIEDKKVKYVHLKVGKMSNVLIDSLNFCFESLITETKFADTKLIVKEVPVVLFCNTCSSKTELTDFNFGCARCGSTKVEMVSGDELAITEIEVE